MLQIFTNKKGFTLIELLVVIAIIGVLASIVLVSMGGARQSARDATRKADMRQIISAQQLYYNATDAFFMSNGWPGSIGTFMPKTPSDPSSSQTYTWVDNDPSTNCPGAPTTAQCFCVYAELEVKPASCAAGSSYYYTASEAGNFGLCLLDPAVPTLAACK